MTAHGTNVNHTYRGCRCARCKKAHARWYADRHVPRTRCTHGRDVARLCEERPLTDHRWPGDEVVVHLGGTRALVARHSPLTAPFLRRAVAS